MRQVGNAHQSKDERKPGGQHKQQSSKSQTVESLDYPDLHKLLRTLDFWQVASPANTQGLLEIA